jgi:soluble lytic murein transglycosylase-like protein
LRLLPAIPVVIGLGVALPAEAAPQPEPAVRAPGPLESLSPALLGVNDIKLYRQIFRLQEDGDWAAADRLIARLENRVLVGHVLYQRYMHPSGYRSQFAELSAWLESYADHPDADLVYRLATRRRPGGVPQPQDPVPGYLGGAGQELQERGAIRYRSALARTADEDVRVERWRDRIGGLLASGEPAAAEAQLLDPAVVPLVDAVEVDLARWEIARGHLAAGNSYRALVLAGRAAARSGRSVPEIRWTAGLSAWRLGRHHLAAWHFAKLVDTPSVLPAERARAAFWTARAHLVAMRPQLVSHYLRLAAAGRDFYGLLARGILGQSLTQGSDRVEVAGTLSMRLLDQPAVRRAIALAQVGRSEEAEREIRKLAARATPELMAGLVALAKVLDLPAAQMRLAQSLHGLKGHYDLSALFPMPTWRPTHGFTLDRALVYAFMRAESGFDPRAESHAGARGLMQVLPATAQFIAARADLEQPHANALFEPETSMVFGQAYLEHLLQRPTIGDNLIFLAAAYNAGPGRVAQWRSALAAEDDPLLFLESIPMREPRVYVKKVLTNLWTYRARLGQPQPSLKALARSQWPTYRPLDERAQVHAWN